MGVVAALSYIKKKNKKNHYLGADVLVVRLLQSLHLFYNVSQALSIEVTFYIYQLGLHLSDLLHLNQLLIS